MKKVHVAVVAIFLVGVLSLIGAWLGAVRASAILGLVDGRLNTLNGQSKTTLDRIGDLDQQSSGLRAELAAARREIKTVAIKDVSGSTTEPTNPLVADAQELHTVAEMETQVQKLGNAPTAQKIAALLDDLDAWIVRPEAEPNAIKLKLGLAARLRQRVVKEVTDEQQASLAAPKGAEAVAHHGAAGQVLALYPMSDDNAVTAEAKRLSARQVEIANRIDALRRQRYNQWVTGQISVAIDGYNKGSSFWSPLKENQVLMDSLVQNLREVDPTLMEPVVMELYNYVIDLTKGSISEKEKVELAKRLTDPAVQRRTLGDF